MLIKSSAEALTDRIGRRGATLISIGLLEVSAGISFFGTPEETFSYLLITDALPVVILALMWIVSGAACIVASFFPTGKDTWGFQAAYPLLMLWGIDVTLSTVSGNYLLGFWRGIFGAVLYFSFSALIFAVSGMDGGASLRKRLGINSDGGEEYSGRS